MILGETCGIETGGSLGSKLKLGDKAGLLFMGEARLVPGNGSGDDILGKVELSEHAVEPELWCANKVD